MAIRKRGRTPLACAVWLGLFAAPQVVAQTWWVTDGTTSTVDGQTYDSGIVANIDGAAVRVENAGSKAVGTNITVKTGGENAPGVVARSDGEVDLADFTVTTTADAARGMLVDSAKVSLRNGSVSTQGLIGTGIDLAQFADAAIDNVDVTAQRSVAIRVSQHSTLAISNGTLTGTTALQVENAGANVTASNVDLVASTANGARAHSNGRITLSGGTVTAQGAGGVGLSAATGASIVAKDGIEVATRGGAAANAASGATITLDDATLRTTEGGIGILADGAGTVVDANAVTVEANGVGVQATAGSQVSLVGTDIQSATSAINIDGATLELDGGSVVGNGADVSAISATRSTIALKGGVDVTGNSNSGLVSNLGTVTMDDAVLRSATRDGALISGGTANVSNSTLDGARWGVYLHSSLASATTVEITDSDIVGGDRAFVMRSYDGIASTASISGGNLRATNAAVAAANGINVLTLANGAHLQSDAGPLIEVMNDASLTTTLDAVDLVGRMQAATTATLDVAF